MSEKKKKKVIGRPFEKGNTMSKGRPPMSKEALAMRRMNKQVLSELLNKHVNTPYPELKAMAKEKLAPGLELIVVTAIVQAIENSDSRARDFLIERMVGKVPVDFDMKSKVEVAGTLNHVHEFQETLLDAIEAAERENLEEH